LAPPSGIGHSHRLRMAVGNGLRGDIWTRFQEQFGIPQILEFYAATEANFSLYNAEGEPGAIGRIPPYLAHRFAIALVRHDAADGSVWRGPDGFCSRVDRGEVGEAIGRIDGGSGRFDGYTNPEESKRKILHDVFEKDDRWFRTGDLMRIDDRGFYYFVDRIGDTFRWKGENVSTTEVEQVLASAPGVHGAVVYGVAVPGTEGRAGMARLVVDTQFNLEEFRSHVRKRLPPYASPLFLRIGGSLAVTETFKHVKHQLSRDGFNPAASTDKFYYDDTEREQYLPLGTARFDRLMSGENRL
jgi:fatty-acyl-CoA synthase